MAIKKENNEEFKFSCERITGVSLIDIPYTVDWKGNGKFVKYGDDNKLP